MLNLVNARRTLLTGGIAAGMLLSTAPAYAATTTTHHAAIRKNVAADRARAVFTHGAFAKANRVHSIEIVRPVAKTVAPVVTPVSDTISPVTAPVTAAVDPSAMPTGDLPGWKQTMAEGFDGSSLPAGWASYEGTPGGEPNAKWLHSHAVVGNGALTLAGYQDGDRFTTAGVMASEGAFSNQTYGKYEIRFKIAKGHGVKYAALLWPSSENWPIDGEIDFAEDGGGDRSTSTGTLHYGADNSQIQKTATGDFSQWTTMGVEWTPGKIVYTMNGQPWATVTGAMVPHTAMNLAIQTQAGTCGSWAGATCPDATTPAHVDMQVDWAVSYSYNP